MPGSCTLLYSSEAIDALTSQKRKEQVMENFYATKSIGRTWPHLCHAKHGHFGSEYHYRASQPSNTHWSRNW